MSTESGKSVQMRKVQPRPTGSAMLWGHLLSKDISSSALARVAGPSGSNSLSPIAPVDKAGTSLRILLHDTQANLEKFSDRVTQLTGGVEDAKREIATVRTLFEQDREKMVEETVDLVNRCQSEIQRTVGNPAQASKVEELHVDLAVADRRLDALDKKMDVLHMLNQTQSQALQTLQDQQGKMLAALVPVLPLLQALPLHIERAENHLKDCMRNIQQPFHSARTVDGSASIRDQNTGQEKRHAASSGAPEASIAQHRKKRKLETHDTQVTSTPNVPPPDRPERTDEPCQVPLIHSVQPHVNLVAQRCNQHTGSPATEQTSLLPMVRGSASAGPKQDPFQTPRRPPLVDLLRPNMPSGAAASLMASGNLTVSDLNPPLRSPSCCKDLGSHARLPPIQGTPKNTDSLTSTTSTLSQRTSLQQAPATDSCSASCVQKAPMIAEQLSPLSSVSSSSVAVGKSPITAHRSIPHADKSVYHPTEQQHVYSFCRTSAFPSAPRPKLQDETLTSVPFSSKYPSVPASGMGGTPASVNIRTMSIRDRRALLSKPSFRPEGKRFIPLDDDDDGDLVLE